MTGYTVHTGSTEKFAAGWDQIFSQGSQVKKPAAGKKKAASAKPKAAAKAKKKKRPASKGARRG